MHTLAERQRVMSSLASGDSVGSLLGCGKVDLHCHILPKRWPDLKEVS